MALEKVIVIDKIEVLEDGQMQIRQVTKVLENGNELGRTYHRWVLVPDQKITTQTNKVKAIAAAVWTSDVVTAWKNKVRK